MYQQHTWSISKIVMVTALIVSAAFAYTILFSQSQEVKADDTVASSSADVSGSNPVIGKDLLLVLEKIESLQLDDSIFSDTAFTSLQDFSVTLASSTPGRSNPFAPLSAGSTKATTKTR